MRRACGSRALLLGAALAAGALLAGPLHAATITIVNGDAAGEGFNDPTPVAPVAGNPATTRGAQRLAVFQAAAAYWANRLQSGVTITVLATLDPLTCTASSAILGAAGPTGGYADFAHAPLAGTWYAPALANALNGSDLDSSQADIRARFNSALDGNAGCLGGAGWFYGIGVPTPAHGFSLYETVRHELGHGLGFLTFVDGSTGALAQGMSDAFAAHLEDHSTGKLWPQMSDAERAASAVDSGDLHWVGPHVAAAAAGLSVGTAAGGHVRMYAPVVLQQGSSVSHWDTVLFPDEVMEPIATLSPNDVVTTAALQDIGWSVQQTGGCTRDAGTACLKNGRFEVKVSYSTSSAGSGDAQLMAFGGQRAESDDSAFYWFFGATNFEMGLKVLDGCAVNGKFWVYLGGLTDQGWTVHVRDTQSGAVRTYGNAIGHVSSTVTDTAAFSCQ